MAQNQSMNVTDNDKLMSLLAWIISVIVPLICLFAEGNKNSKFQRYHAINSLMVTAVEVIVSVIIMCPLSILTAGVGGICAIPLTLVFLGAQIYYGVKAYQGEMLEVPGLTQFAKNQGWL